MCEGVGGGCVMSRFLVVFTKREFFLRLLIGEICVYR